MKAMSIFARMVFYLNRHIQASCLKLTALFRKDTSFVIFVPVSIALFAVPIDLKSQARKPSPAGDWIGTLHVQSQELHLALHVVDDNRAFSVTLDSIDQGVRAIPGGIVTFKSQSFSFEIPSIQASYHGLLSQDGKAITGTWSQGSANLPLIYRSRGRGVYRRN